MSGHKPFSELVEQMSPDAQLKVKDGIDKIVAEELQHELAILTNDGWVVTLVADKEITLGDAVVKQIIVQPKEDYAKRITSDIQAKRRTYQVGAHGEVIYSE